jgi:hypothetical protein
LLHKQAQVLFIMIIAVGDFFEEWNEITPQIHIRKFDEVTA